MIKITETIWGSLHTPRMANSTGKKTGISRLRNGKGFIYKLSGKKITNKSSLERIKKLRIPPAWKDVWISKNESAKLQAYGFDAKKRKQYIYHPAFRQRQEKTKYKNIALFAKALPKIRAKVRSHLKRRNLDKKKISAAIIALMESTLIRVGNEQYAKNNNSYGLTTLKDKHVKFSGNTIEFKFLGKSKINHNIKINDKKLAPIVRKSKELKGDELFQYVDENGKVRDIKSSHINTYLKEITGNNFTVKDFRTWAGTVLAAIALKEYKNFDTKAAAKKYVKQAIESVAKKLGNTPAICKKCYIHPEIIESYMNGGLMKALKVKVNKALKTPLKGLSAQEGVVLAFLQKSINKRR